MYLRAIHAEHDMRTLRAFVRANPLGILTTAIRSRSGAFPLLQSSHIPWVLDVPDDETELGTLRGHMARANPQTKAMIESLSAHAVDGEGEGEGGGGDEGGPRTLEEDVLIVFNGPAHHYVTPKFYVETKPGTGKVVPTWDYAAVEVYGRARVYVDGRSAATDAFLSGQVADLSAMCEREVMGYERPWVVGDAPRGYVEVLKRAIVGIEVEVRSMAGKWKMSQELPEGDRKGVVDGFEGLGSDSGREMARTVREREELMEKRKEEGKA